MFRKRVVRFLEKNGVNLGERGIFEELLRGSNLTEAQAETLLVELASAMSGLKLSVEEKAGIRGVSKGAYSRTKRQALENVKRSIYTLLLLRFLGVLGDEALSLLMEAAGKLVNGDSEEALEALRQMTLHDVTE
ncbi:hypothetical protein B6U84_05890 [Candidatus Bathyarchaeota archaeon ex4484_40]|nr:MAG: hypothetical protein B6U84_05890 [Candidatus Bathyarchaeota archaeon ex4484_40]